jgi:tetratricopeptide (TPR) repeat protein
MTPQNNLELNGNLHDHPLAELLVEISEAFLNGSLRLSNEEYKAIIYFDAGEVVFAVSNARQHRLAAILLREEKISQPQIAEIGQFANDLELKNLLIEKEIISGNEINSVITLQIQEILKTALGWKEGKWHYSSLVRAKAGMRFRVDLRGILFEYARCLPNALLVRRFNSLQERFDARTHLPAHINLYPQESFVFSRFGHESLTVEDIKNIGGLSEIEILKILYTLWLGGFIKRQKWNWAFSKEKIFAISTAKIALKKNEATVPLPRREIGIETVEEVAPVKKEEIAEDVSLETYLERVENGATFYEILDVAPDADAAQIKARYFSLAKRFHPDLFHRQTEAETHRRIQNAFTKIAHGYETLKDEKTREVYDYKIGKQKTDLSNQRTFGAQSGSNSSELEKQASESFEQGFSFLMDEIYAEAIPLLARAVHLAGGNARYRAYYGKALAANKTTQRQAENEFQAAVRLDPGNAQYRLMLAELFINIGHIKRAEGELNRLLEKFPNHYEARSLLDSLRNK